MTASDDHVVFDFGEPDEAGLMLCVVDDIWYEVIRFVTEVEDPSSEEQQNRWADDRLWDEDAWNKLAVAMLPVYARDLPGLARLVVTGFPEAADSASFLDSFLRDPNHRWRTAFLVDIHDADCERSLGDQVVLPKLGDMNIPASHCAYFTVGKRAKRQLEYITKSLVYKHKGQLLADFWSRVQGGIDDTFFMEWTTNRIKKGHSASEIPEVLANSGFQGFLVLQASLDKYGVWEWLREILSSDADTDEKRYAYSCGKAFLKSGCNWCDRDFPYAALRGLVRGLASGQVDERNAGIEELPSGVPPAFLADVNNIFQPGRCDAGFAKFEVFAKALRDWLQRLEVEGPARLAEVCLKRGDHGCKLELCFSERLPARIFASKEVVSRGRVTDAWRKLAGCFGPGQEPTVSEDYQRVCLRFTFIAES